MSIVVIQGAISGLLIYLAVNTFHRADAQEWTKGFICIMAGIAIANFVISAINFSKKP